MPGRLTPVGWLFSGSALAITGIQLLKKDLPLKGSNIHPLVWHLDLTREKV